MGERPGQASAFEKAKRFGLVAAASLALDAGCGPSGCAEPAPDSTEQKAPDRKIEFNPFFESNPDYLRAVEGGEFSASERRERMETLPGGEQIFHDIGLDFYQVKKGDTISEIRQRLVKYPKYAHLESQTNKLHSFNIPAKKLQVGMWLPIPLENADRQLTDEQFAHYAQLGIGDVKKHKEYGPYIQEILKEVSEDDLVATMVAVAKQESGGLPLGQFESHRWEQRYKAFSFSMLHVLMERGGPGIAARRDLDMTEGQTYHPRNAVKLFLGFLVEKAVHDLHERPRDYFPVDKHGEKFARFYNGRAWKSINPHYVTNLTRYYREAQALLKEG